jgi:hypothetical protein
MHVTLEQSPADVPRAQVIQHLQNGSQGDRYTMILYLLLKLRENVQNVKFLPLRWFEVLKEKKRIILCI